MAAATGDGQGEGKRQRRGSRAELQVEIVKCFDGRGRKEKRSRGGRPHPGSEIGKVESRCEWRDSITERDLLRCARAALWQFHSY